MNENKFTDLFTSYWYGNTAYKVSWCDNCDIYSIDCPGCNNSSCNGGGCAVCRDDFNTFNGLHIQIEDFLNEEQIITLKKIRQLKRHILTCLAAGRPPIDWAYLDLEGELSPQDYKWFENEILNAK